MRVGDKVRFKPDRVPQELKGLPIANNTFIIRFIDDRDRPMLWCEGMPDGYFVNRFELVDDKEIPVVKKVKELLEPGVKVKVIHNNKDRAAGYATDEDVGKEFILGTIHTKRDAAQRLWDQSFNVWRLIGSEYVYDERSLEFIAKKDKNGKWRNSKGHFCNVKAAVEKPLKPVDEERAFDNWRVSFNERVTGGNVGTCSFGIWHYAKNKPFEYISAPCHATLNRKNDMKNSKIALNVNGHYQGFLRDTKENYKKAVQWVIRDSFLAHAFVTKDIEEALVKGVVMEGTTPKSLVCIASVFLRGFSEFPNQLSGFTEMVDMGMNKNVAWLMSLLFVRREKHWVWSGTTDGHRTFTSAAISFERIKEFISNGSLSKEADNTPWNQSHSGFRCHQPISGVNQYRWPGKEMNLDRYCMKNAPFNVKETGFGNKTKTLGDAELLAFAKEFE